MIDSNEPGRAMQPAARPNDRPPVAGIRVPVSPVLAVLLLLAAFVPWVSGHAGEADTAALLDAQRRLRTANDDLGRAERAARRAREKVEEARVGVQEAEKAAERARARLDEATQGKADADAAVAAAQRAHEAARAEIERFYDARSR